MTEQIVFSVLPALRASAARDDTPTAGFPWAIINPLRVLAPMRRPVNDPGPSVQANRSIPDILQPASLQALSMAGRRTSEWFSPVLRTTSYKTVSFCITATDAVFDDVSKAKINIVYLKNFKTSLTG